MTTTADPQLSRGALIALVVGSMIGAGIFTLPAAFGRTTGALGALIAWVIAGTGMLMLAFVFQTLSRRKPELDAGIYVYAKAGFGSYLGFSAAFGYWIACCLACLACLVLSKATLGQFLPAFGDGSTAVAIAGASAVVWGVHLLVLRGVKQAAALNTIATVAKVVPIGIFVVVVVMGFRADVFALNFWGAESASLSDVAGQVRDTMLVTVFVFVGIEGASVYSRYAKDRNDVGAATVLGFLGVLCLLMLVTVFSYGVLLRPELAALANPSMAGVMEAIVGPWGRVFVSVGLLISVAGNYLSWSLLAAEVLHSAAQDGTMPSALARENARRVPHVALWLTNIAIQLFLVVTWFADYAFTLALKMTSAMTLIPYLLVAAYGFKLAWTGETYGADARNRTVDRRIGALATVYAAAMLLAGGAKFLLLSALLYAPGAALHVYARREQRVKVFGAGESIVFAGVCVAALAGLYALVSGAMTI
ncbi:MAG: basic amino acid/polyamine antiporter [Burkholderiaceae bacterium]|jgi:arginine:ornithine antiporter/lysine permease|nr:basic amino acid/polyamine antiporter [Burkholderiales bacterium]MCZ8338439.1 basic amino acid/polyamine antiporter [Burkholderiaceae bacterium]